MGVNYSTGKESFYFLLLLTHMLILYIYNKIKRVFFQLPFLPLLYVNFSSINVFCLLLYTLGKFSLFFLFVSLSNFIFIFFYN